MPRTPVMPSIAIASALTACSPTSRLEIRFAAPERVGAELQPDRFHFVGSKSCPPAHVATPTAGVSRGDVEYYQAERVQGGLRVIAAFRGRRCTVQVTGWYDRDGDERVDSGDFIGSSTPLEIADRGLFAGNLTAGGDVQLVQVP